MTEAELQAGVVQVARLLGFLVYHTYDSRRSEGGFPDLIMVRESRLVAAELKVQGRRMTSAQQLWLDVLSNVHGGVEVYVWREEDWQSGRIERILRGRPEPGR